MKNKKIQEGAGIKDYYNKQKNYYNKKKIEVSLIFSCGVKFNIKHSDYKNAYNGLNDFIKPMHKTINENINSCFKLADINNAKIIRERLILLNKIYRFSSQIGQTFGKSNLFKLNQPKNYYYKHRHGRVTKVLKKTRNYGSKIRKRFYVDSLWAKVAVFREVEIKLQQHILQNILKRASLDTIKIKIKEDKSASNSLDNESNRIRKIEGSNKADNYTQEQLIKTLTEYDATIQSLTASYVDNKFNYYIKPMKFSNIQYMLLKVPKKNTGFLSGLKKISKTIRHPEEIDSKMNTTEEYQDKKEFESLKESDPIYQKHEEANGKLLKLLQSKNSIYLKTSTKSTESTESTETKVPSKDTIIKEYIENYNDSYKIDNDFFELSNLFMFNLEKKPYIDIGQVSMLSYENKLDASLSDVAGKNTKPETLIYSNNKNYFSNIIHLPKFIIHHLDLVFKHIHNNIGNSPNIKDDYIANIFRSMSENIKTLFYNKNDLNLIESDDPIALSDATSSNVNSSSMDFSTISTTAVNDSDKILLPISTLYALFAIKDFNKISNLGYSTSTFTREQTLIIGGDKTKPFTNTKEIFYITEKKDIISGTLLYLYKQIAFHLDFLLHVKQDGSTQSHGIYDLFLEDICNMINKKILDSTGLKNVKRNMGIFRGIDNDKLYKEYIKMVLIQHLNRIILCINDLLYLTTILELNYLNNTNETMYNEYKNNEFYKFVSNGDIKILSSVVAEIDTKKETSDAAVLAAESAVDAARTAATRNNNATTLDDLNAKTTKVTQVSKENAILSNEKIKIDNANIVEYDNTTSKKNDYSIFIKQYIDSGTSKEDINSNIDILTKYYMNNNILNTNNIGKYKLYDYERVFKHGGIIKDDKRIEMIHTTTLAPIIVNNFNYEFDSLYNFKVDDVEYNHYTELLNIISLKGYSFKFDNTEFNTLLSNIELLKVDTIDSELIYLILVYGYKYVLDKSNITELQNGSKIMTTDLQETIIFKCLDEIKPKLNINIGNPSYQYKIERSLNIQTILPTSTTKYSFKKTFNILNKSNNIFYYTGELDEKVLYLEILKKNLPIYNKKYKNTTQLEIEIDKCVALLVDLKKINDKIKIAIRQQSPNDRCYFFKTEIGTGLVPRDNKIIMVPSDSSHNKATLITTIETNNNRANIFETIGTDAFIGMLDLDAREENIKHLPIYILNDINVKKQLYNYNYYSNIKHDDNKKQDIVEKFNKSIVKISLFHELLRIYTYDPIQNNSSTPKNKRIMYFPIQLTFINKESAPDTIYNNYLQFETDVKMESTPISKDYFNTVSTRAKIAAFYNDINYNIKDIFGSSNPHPPPPPHIPSTFGGLLNFPANTYGNIIDNTTPEASEDKIYKIFGDLLNIVLQSAFIKKYIKLCNQFTEIIKLKRKPSSPQITEELEKIYNDITPIFTITATPVVVGGPAIDMKDHIKLPSNYFIDYSYHLINETSSIIYHFDDLLKRLLEGIPPSPENTITILNCVGYYKNSSSIAAPNDVNSKIMPNDNKNIDTMFAEELNVFDNKKINFSSILNVSGVDTTYAINNTFKINNGIATAEEGIIKDFIDLYDDLQTKIEAQLKAEYGNKLSFTGFRKKNIKYIALSLIHNCVRKKELLLKYHINSEGTYNKTNTKQFEEDTFLPITVKNIINEMRKNKLEENYLTKTTLFKNETLNDVLGSEFIDAYKTKLKTDVLDKLPKCYILKTQEDLEALRK